MEEEGEVILNTDDTAEHAQATYTPRDRAGANDVGMFLRVKATYEDRRGKRKTAEAVSRHPVLAAIVNTNTPPRFTAEDAERRVNENTPKGTAVGRPVTANDPDDEKLSYTLFASTDPQTDAGDLSRAFQDRLGDRPDYGGWPTWTLKTQEARRASISTSSQVRATDSRALSTGTDVTPDHIQVTIYVVDLDESPEINRPRAGDVDDPTDNPTNPISDVLAPMLILHAGGNAIERSENAALSAIATYIIEDDDEGTPTLSVAGSDADMFTFKYYDAPTGDR